MPARVALLTPARRFIANSVGLGYQIPLGMVCIGGPLVDAGHNVTLIDNDLYGWSLRRLVDEIRAFRAGYVLIGHTGSTAAHTTAIGTIRAIRRAMPNLKIVYGGVYPSYAAKSILMENPEIDAIVRGEGEETIVDLIDAWENGGNLHEVHGISWRQGDTIHTNRSRAPIQDLDAYRPGWELVDWPRYKMFGFAPVAGLQFSRGCPLTCTYCGQWLFWRKWRHRSIESTVEQLRTLVEQYGVTFVWFADENFSADRETVQELLQSIVDAKLGLAFNLNMTAADIVRDADLMPLYKAAGVHYIVTGVEALEDNVIQNIRKNNPFSVSKQAVSILRENNILSLVNIIYGLQDESWTTIFKRFRRLLELDADIVNAEYLTPHFWTADGRSTRPEEIIQTDLSKWTYRNQVIAAPHLKPGALFLGVKLTEAIFHLRLKALWRLLKSRDRIYLSVLRQSFVIGIRVFLAEVYEFLFQTRFSPQGSLDKIPGSEISLPVIRRTAGDD